MAVYKQTLPEQLLGFFRENVLNELGDSLTALTQHRDNPYTHVSHSHCWAQKQPPACGIPLEKHDQCCLCDVPYNPHECSDPKLSRDCSGCTDLRGDPMGGTHQGCTKQHGHIGCNLAV